MKRNAHRSKTAIAQFFHINQMLCNKIEQFLPSQFTRSLLYQHELICADRMNNRSHQIVVDMGGGHKAPFARHRREGSNTFIIGVDILESQVRGNRMIDAGTVADLCADLPFHDNSVDIFITRSVLEHLRNNDNLFYEIARCLKPGGCSINVMPYRYSPFPLLNRLLPASLTQRLLYFFLSTMARIL